MSEILAQWLPILVSAVGVFIASTILHMVLSYHRSNYSQMPGEEKVLEAMRSGDIQPGMYMFPHCEDMKDLASPGMLEKFQQGPVGHLTVTTTGSPTIGKNLMQWFLFSISIGVFCAYVASFTLPAEADYMARFRLVGTVAFLGYGWASLTESIWKMQPWSTTFKFLVDGLVYALVTAGVFGWLGA